MHLFHCPDLSAELIELPEEEAHHARSVLRLNLGERIGSLDGKGLRVEAELVEITKRRVVAKIVSRNAVEIGRSARIHLAVAPTKQMERFEWFVEKAVELGVDRITPLATARTERARLRPERLKRVAVAAMKQSQRTWLPQIDDLTEMKVLLEEALPDHRYFGWCEGQHDPLMRVYDPNYHALVLIGPEGDFAPEEATLLRTHGFTAVALGAARLRTETAALAACTWMSLAQQR
jgi:16S rRNA (uracil1498-N3)-methyltransferase